jgi:hypothetical protein
MRDCACRILAVLQPHLVFTTDVQFLITHTQALFSSPNAIGDTARAKAMELGLQVTLGLQYAI